VKPVPQKDDYEAEHGGPRLWLRWYSIVLVELALLITAFYFFTKAFE
jgi:hypothetical protein